MHGVNRQQIHTDPLVEATRAHVNTWDGVVKAHAEIKPGIGRKALMSMAAGIIALTSLATIKDGTSHSTDVERPAPAESLLINPR